MDKNDYFRQRRAENPSFTSGAAFCCNTEAWLVAPTKHSLTAAGQKNLVLTHERRVAVCTRATRESSTRVVCCRTYNCWLRTHPLQVK